MSFFLFKDQCYSQSDVFFSLTNDGAFIARCSIQYNYDGSNFNRFCNPTFAGQNKKIDIPSNAKGVFLKVDIMQLLGKWTTVYEKHVSATDRICVKLSGTTFNFKSDVNC